MLKRVIYVSVRGRNVKPLPGVCLPERNRIYGICYTRRHGKHGSRQGGYGGYACLVTFKLKGHKECVLRPVNPTYANQ